MSDFLTALGTEPWKSVMTMILTLGVTTFTAWLTVRLALNRFKSERLWDRQLSTYSDLIEALSEMDRVNGIWLDREMEQRDENKEYEAELSERYKTAKRRFESTSATARFILGAEVEAAIKGIEDGIEASRQAQSYFDSIDTAGAAISKGRDRILELARANHRLNAKAP